MSDSVDRVFVHALATVRRLPRTGSSRPPPSSRLRLYGLYKQSMEGDVAAVIPRPTLPTTPPSQNPSDPNDPSSSLHRSSSRDQRTREAQAEIEKWDSWHACAGMSRTEAKRQYITTLIDTMKEYASGTVESRELVGELEFVWNQIREQSGSDPDDGNNNNDDDDNSAGSGNGNGNGKKESPTRVAGGADMGSFSSNRVSIGSSGDHGSGGGGSGFGLVRSRSQIQQEGRQVQQVQQQAGNGKPRTRPVRTESGLRVLSPVSQRDDDSIIEPVDAEEDDPDAEQTDRNNNQQHFDAAPDLSSTRTPANQHQSTSSESLSLSQWQRSFESHLRALQVEIAALREQLSANHLLSSSSYSHTYYTMSTRQRLLHRAKIYFLMMGATLLRQITLQLGVLAVVLLWGRINGDLRIEKWVRERLRSGWRGLRWTTAALLSWMLDLFGPDGRLAILGRVLRIF